jgi:hypothetical protein
MATGRKKDPDNPKRSKPMRGEDFEVAFLAKEAGISEEQARVLVRRYGNDRAKIMEEAKLLRDE